MLLWIRRYAKHVDAIPTPEQVDAVAVSATSHDPNDPNDCLDASGEIDAEVGGNAAPATAPDSAAPGASTSNVEVEMMNANAARGIPDEVEDEDVTYL